MARSVTEVAEICIGSYLLDRGPDPAFGEIFATTVIGRHNYDSGSVNYDGVRLAEEMLARRVQIDQLMPDFRVENHRLHIANKAFAFVHTSCGTLPDGTQVRIPACSIFEVEDGKIISVNSVSDFAHRAALESALEKMVADGSQRVSTE